MNRYRLDESKKAWEALHNSMPFTAIDIMQELKEKYTLSNLEYSVLAFAYNESRAYDKTKELVNEIDISNVDDNNFLFVIAYTIALSETGEFREAIAIRERVITLLASKDTYLAKAQLVEEYTRMAKDYFSLMEYNFCQKWMDKAIALSLSLSHTDIIEVAKGTIIDKRLADCFLTYYTLLQMKNPLDKENDLYIALSAACGNLTAIDHFRSAGKNFKKILNKYLKKMDK